MWVVKIIYLDGSEDRRECESEDMAREIVFRATVRMSGGGFGIDDVVAWWEE